MPDLCRLYHLHGNSGAALADDEMGIKDNAYFLARKLGAHRLPKSFKKPVGDFLIGYSGKDEKVPFFQKRVEFVAELVEKAVRYDGSLAECGVFRGVTTAAIGRKLKELKSDKTLYGIDYFDVFPYDDNDFPFEQEKIIRKKFTQNKGEKIPSIQEIQAKMDSQNLDNVKLIKGLVEDVLPTLPDQKFCFVNVDVDSYRATKFCLEYFKPKMSEGGIIFLDDYNEPGWPGATKAADEILGKKDIRPLRHVQAYWTKTTTQKY